MQVLLKDSIPLPNKLRKSWKGRTVVIVSSRDALLVKRVHARAPSSLREKLKSIGKKIASKDIASAIRSARA